MEMIKIFASLTIAFLTILSSTNALSSNYTRSVTVDEGSSGDWYWEVSEKYAVALTTETNSIFGTNHLALICRDDFEESCAYALHRQKTPCPSAYSHTLHIKFPKERFTINARCVNTHNEGSFVLLPSEDDDGFRAFAKAMLEESWANVRYEPDGKTLLNADFSLIGSSKAIKTASLYYMQGYFRRAHEQANREMYESLERELSKEDFEKLMEKMKGQDLVELEYVP